MSTTDNWVVRAVNGDGEPVDNSPLRFVGTATASEGGGAFEDTDGDDVAELQSSHADMGGGDLRNAGAVNPERIGNTHVYASSYGSDGAAIQSALDEHGTNPSIVHVDVTTTVGSAAPLEVPSNTTVVVEGDITLADETPENIFQNATFGDDTVTDTNINFIGRGGSLDGNKANQTRRTDDDGTGYGIGAFHTCISLVGIDIFRIVGLALKNPETHGVNLMAAGRGRVSENDVVGDTGAAIHSHYRMSDNTYNHNITISDNVVLDGGTSGGESAALYVSGVINHVIDGNTVDTRDNHGINVAGRLDGTYNVTVSDNTIRDVAATTTYYTPRGAINLVTGTTTSGTIDTVTVEGNTIIDTGATANSQCGVSVNSRGAIISNFTIADNSVNTHNHAISLNGTADRQIREYGVTDNTLTTRTDVNARGVDCTDVAGGNIATNSISDTQASAIALRAVDSAGTSSVYLHANWVLLPGENSSASDQHGLFVQDAQNCGALANTFRNGGDHGILETASGSDNVFLLNECRFATNAGTDLNGTATITDAVNQDTTENWNIT